MHPVVLSDSFPSAQHPRHETESDAHQGLVRFKRPLLKYQQMFCQQQRGNRWLVCDGKLSFMPAIIIHDGESRSCPLCVGAVVIHWLMPQ
jgi:hypothetical protein